MDNLSLSEQSYELKVYDFKYLLDNFPGAVKVAELLYGVPILTPSEVCLILQYKHSQLTTVIRELTERNIVYKRTIDKQTLYALTPTGHEFVEYVRRWSRRLDYE